MGSCQSRRHDVIVDKDLPHTPDVSSTASPPVQDYESDMSTVMVSQPSGILSSSEAIMTFGDQSLSTMDPRSLYGGRYSGGEASLSDGFTLSSYHMTSSAYDSSTTDGEDDSFFYQDSILQQQEEELLHIHAPCGKLGLVLDTPNHLSCAIVHTIKDCSPLVGKLKEGDKLLALDDEDVQCYTAVKISKMLSRKSGNATRKLTVSRVLVQ